MFISLKSLKYNQWGFEEASSELKTDQKLPYVIKAVWD